jgi:hypothetical protein
MLSCVFDYSAGKMPLRRLIADLFVLNGSLLDAPSGWYPEFERIWNGLEDVYSALIDQVGTTANAVVCCGTGSATEPLLQQLQLLVYEHIAAIGNR